MIEYIAKARHQQQYSSLVTLQKQESKSKLK